MRQRGVVTWDCVEADLHDQEDAACRSALPQAPTSPLGCRLINVHVISTLGVPEDKVLPCIECWCQDDKVTSRGKLGGGACCSSSLCPSTLPNTTETTYLLQYNVSYRQASRPSPMFLLALQQPAACGPACRQLAGPALLSCCRCWHLKGYCLCYACLLACLLAKAASAGVLQAAGGPPGNSHWPHSRGSGCRLRYCQLLAARTATWASVLVLAALMVWPPKSMQSEFVVMHCKTLATAGEQRPVQGSML